MHWGNRMNFEAITRLAPWLVPLSTTFSVIIVVLLIGVSINALKNRQHLHQKEALQSYAFPMAYHTEVRLRYPHLTKADVAKGFEQLRFYFWICWKKEPKTVAMPSKLVDACWHAFITDTRNYRQFCDDVYGCFLHHMPRVEVCLPQDEKNDDGERAKVESKDVNKLKLTIKAQELDAARVYHWAVMLQKPVVDDHQVSTDASIDMAVPLLFTIDQDMRIPDGYFYSPEVIRFLVGYDLKAAESAAASLDSTAAGSLGAGCGDGGVACGGCGGST